MTLQTITRIIDETAIYTNSIMLVTERLTMVPENNPEVKYASSKHLWTFLAKIFAMRKIHKLLNVTYCGVAFKNPF